MPVILKEPAMFAVSRMQIGLNAPATENHCNVSAYVVQLILLLFSNRRVRLISDMLMSANGLKIALAWNSIPITTMALRKYNILICKTCCSRIHFNGLTRRRGCLGKSPQWLGHGLNFITKFSKKPKLSIDCCAVRTVGDQYTLRGVLKSNDGCH